MNKNLTDITLLLDRSGSMESMAKDVVEGVRKFIEGQREAPGEATLTLIQFDSQDSQEVLYTARPIEKATFDSFVPRGGTPLRDAMGRAIDATGRRLRELPEKSRPGKVVFVVFTDGMENESREYTQKRLQEMVKHQQEKYDWQFVFLGAGLDAFSQHSATGVQYTNAVQLTPQNFVGAFTATSANLRSYRVSGQSADLSYSNVQREELVSDDPPVITSGSTTVVTDTDSPAA